jgi:hypothetical protein
MKHTTTVRGLLTLLMMPFTSGCIQVVVEQPAPKSSAAPTTDAKDTSQAPPTAALASKEATPAPPTATPASKEATPAPPTATPASKESPISTTAKDKEKIPEIPTVTLANARELMREANCPSFLFMYHSKHLRPQVEAQLRMFALESKKYPQGLGFRLVDLDTDDGAQIAAVMLKPHAENLRRQITDVRGTGFLFYFPGGNNNVLLTYGTEKDMYVFPALNEESLEAFVWQRVNIKPTTISTVSNSDPKDNATNPTTKTGPSLVPVSSPPTTGSPPNTEDTKNENVPELPFITLKNGSSLLYGSKTPRIMYWFHSKDLTKAKTLSEQLTIFKTESVRYDPRVVFLLVDLDDASGDGEKLWRALVKSDPDVLPHLSLLWPDTNKFLKVEVPVFNAEILKHLIGDNFKIEPTAPKMVEK